MKKNILTLVCLFFLISCNTDSIQEKLGYISKLEFDSVTNTLSQKVDSLSLIVSNLQQDAELLKKDTRPLFSVNPHVKVFFSKGNLQYQPSTGIWRFAENQQEVIGESNKNISARYTGWIDLFGWGTSGWKKAAKPSDVSPRYDDYFVGGGPNNSITGFYAQGDWGVYNRISNGGNVEGKWRTLTMDEWDYLLFKRLRANQLHFHAQIDSVYGLVLMPDNWDGSVDEKFQSYTATEWATLDSIGGVFLPQAGYRHGKNVFGVNSYGFYWASTAGEFGASYIQIDSASVSVYGSYRGSGRSVRLVRQVDE